jgi:hypothetical protein
MNKLERSSRDRWLLAVPAGSLISVTSVARLKDFSWRCQKGIDLSPSGGSRADDGGASIPRLCCRRSRSQAVAELQKPPLTWDKALPEDAQSRVISTDNAEIAAWCNADLPGRLALANLDAESRVSASMTPESW